MSVALVCDLCGNVYKAGKGYHNAPFESETRTITRLPVLRDEEWGSGDACPECVVQYECFLCWRDEDLILPCPEGKEDDFSDE